MRILFTIRRSAMRRAMAALLLMVMAGLVGSLVPRVSSAAEQNEATRYVIQLKQGVLPAAVAPFGMDLQHRFAFSSENSFKNIYSFSSSLPLGALRQRLAGEYTSLEVDATVDARATMGEVVVTNDPWFTTNSLDIDSQWGLAKAQFPLAWRKARGTNAVVAAVIDTGVDESHEDLRQVNFWPGYDFVHDTPITQGSNSDDNGHGTLVTGVFAATPNNGIGIAGAAWAVSVLPVKALDSQGRGTASNIAEAIVWASDRGANVINMSLGGLGFDHDTVLANAISYAYTHNVVIVAAAGNDVATTGGNLDRNPVFPVCDDNGANMIIGVAASDQNDIKPAFSNFGKNCVDVTAPGQRIVSTINHDPFNKAARPNAYAYASGTSLAVPFVTGEVILLKGLFPNASAAQIRDRILSSSDPIDSSNLSQCGDASCAGYLGAGRINAAKAVATDIVQFVIKEGDLVQLQSTGQLYYISGGKKRIVTPYVKSQRFAGTPIKNVTESDLLQFSDGPYAEPLDGTLVKLTTDPTVYYISKGLKLPVTGQVFGMRGFKFSDVVPLSFTEMNSWLTGSFLAPPDGSLVRTPKNQTVYWVVEGTLHPITFEFYRDRGLRVFPVVYISDTDLRGFSKGEAYTR